MTLSVRLLLFVVLALPAAAQQATTPDLILVDGQVLTVDADDRTVEGLAIAGEHIIAVGSSQDMRALAGEETRIVELGGRTVIPGLIDSHMHAIRGGMYASWQVDWYRARSVAEALEMLRAEAEALPDDTWLIVVGAWHESQFTENRLPTAEEIQSAAGAHPVYIQYGRAFAYVNDRALSALGVETDADIPPNGHIERDGNGERTGRILGDRATVEAIVRRIPRPQASLDDQVDATKAFLANLNRYGITGVIDPMGGQFYPDDYDAVFELWRRREMTVRIAFRVMSQRRGGELEDLKSFAQFLPQGFGDEWLAFNGFGEALTWAMYDGALTRLEFDAPPVAVEAFAEMAQWLAERRYAAEIHAASDVLARQLLDILEEVDGETPIDDLRWSFTHLENGSPETLARMKALGMGYGVQNRAYFAGGRLAAVIGEDAARHAPPIQTALDAGLIVAGGTDFPGAPYNPWVSLRWFLDGKSVSGAVIRGPEETPGRLDALRIYTLNSAWMSFDEDERGSLEVGKLADLAVLSADYLATPVESIASIESVMTIVGGEIVYAAEPFAP